jgi:hypothetical protein
VLVYKTLNNLPCSGRSAGRWQPHFFLELMYGAASAAPIVAAFCVRQHHDHKYQLLIGLYRQCDESDGVRGRRRIYAFSDIHL